MASPPSHSQNVLPDPENLVLNRIVQTDHGFVLERATSGRLPQVRTHFPIAS